MKKTITLLLLLVTVLAHSQKKKQGPSFNIMAFNTMAATAEWLYAYDAVAWWTSDIVMEAGEEERNRLGGEWFCYQDQNNLWHALYGKLQDNHFQQVFHFALDSDYKITRSNEEVDADFADGYARALALTAEKINPLRKSVKLGFNPYIRKNDDQTYTVWYFPAFQQDGTAIYGGEYVYTVDAKGQQILKEDKLELEAFRGFKTDPPREIHLDYTKYKEPTLGGVFFVWYYKKYFTNIYLETSQSKSTVFKHDNGSYYWVHLDKTGMKKEKKSKK